MSLSELQQQVFDHAKAWLEQKPWFKGVSMDDFPTDEEIKRDGVEDSAMGVVMNTAYWDASDFMNP